MEDFGAVLQATLTPIALISGIGLLLLSMVNRYNHAIDRVRQLLREKGARPEADRYKIDDAVRVIYKRCKMMRNAILSVATSIVASGGIVLATALEGFTGLDLSALKALLLMVSIVLVVVAAVMFVLEVTYSLHALQFELEG